MTYIHEVGCQWRALTSALCIDLSVFLKEPNLDFFMGTFAIFTALSHPVPPPKF